MFSKFFETTVVDETTAWVVQALSQVLPPARIDDPVRQTLKRREQVLERVRRHAESLASTTQLNLYQKAKLGIRLAEALEAAGYPTAFSKPFAYEVVSLVAMALSARR
jgi:hypothetical protein